MFILSYVCNWLTTTPKGFGIRFKIIEILEEMFSYIHIDVCNRIWLFHIFEYFDVKLSCSKRFRIAPKSYGLSYQAAYSITPPLWSRRTCRFWLWSNNSTLTSRSTPWQPLSLSEDSNRNNLTLSIEQTSFHRMERRLFHGKSQIVSVK